jgi:hypothetical protein
MRAGGAAGEAAAAAGADFFALGPAGEVAGEIEAAPAHRRRAVVVVPVPVTGRSTDDDPILVDGTWKITSEKAGLTI